MFPDTTPPTTNSLPFAGMPCLPQDPAIPLIHTRLCEARVYYNSAILKRTGELFSCGQTGRFYIAGIPLSAAADQIRFVFSKPSVSWHITGIYQILPCLSKEDEACMKELRQEKASLESRIKVLTLQQEALCDSLSFSGRSNRCPDEELSYIEAFPARFKKLEEKASALNEQLKELEEGIRRLEEKTRPLPVIELEVYGLSLSCTFSLSYQDPRVSWEPFYDISIRQETHQLEVCFRGKLHVSSDEDWDLDSITFLTGSWMPINIPPALPVWKLRSAPKPLEPHPLPGPFHSPAGPCTQDFHTGMAPSLPLPPSADSTYFLETGDIISDLFEPVKGPADDFLKEYHRKGPIRFRKGIRDLVVRITEDVIPVSFNCLAVPKQDSCCHLTAQIRAASSCSLLPIPAHLFIGETALGQIYLPQPDKDDNLLLTLCREPKLRVTRSLIRRDTQKPDPNRTQHTSFFRIDLTNTGDRPRSLQVLDQIPVSEDPDVCVELIEAGGAQLRPVTGELKWELLLRPGESRSLTFGFTVTHPAGQRLFL